MNAKRGIIFLFISLASVAITPDAFAALSYGSGTYTNLCGTGLSATENTCNGGCNTTTGICSASAAFVAKFTCDGSATECRNNESNFSTSHSLTGASCGKTVQIDVYNKTCRVNGNWVCSQSDLKDYMVWYSGDCPGTTATPTPSPTLTTTPTTTPIPALTSSCDSISIASGNNTVVPATVTVSARGTDSRGSIQAYRFFWGDGKFDETTSSEMSHRYETSGTFLARAEVRDSLGAWKSSAACETTLTVQSIPVETHKSDCSDLFINEGNYTRAPTTAKYTASGYDNKGSIKRYKVDFGDGTTNEQADNKFQHYYASAGTYSVRGYILDSRDNWKGGSGSCQKSFYANTAPLAKQPSTGTPTAFTLIALTGGLWSFSLFFVRKYWV